MYKFKFPNSLSLYTIPPDPLDVPVDSIITFSFTYADVSGLTPELRYVPVPYTELVPFIVPLSTIPEYVEMPFPAIPPTYSFPSTFAFTITLVRFVFAVAYPIIPPI